MLNSIGQTSFEGTIYYDVQMPGETVAAKLILSFGINKIKMEFIVPGKTSDNDYNLFDLDSGKLYTMNVRDKSYEVKLLFKREALPAPSSKKIAGHRTTALIQQQYERPTENDFLASLNNGIFYTADDLHYSIPQVYEGNAELVMVKNNKVVLGAEIELPEMLWNTTGSEAGQNKSRAIITATSIVPVPPDLNALAVPEGYTNKTLKDLVYDAGSQLKDSLDSKPEFRQETKAEKKSSKPIQKKLPTAKAPSVLRKKD